MSTRIAQSKFTNLFVNHFEKMHQSHIKSMGGYQTLIRALPLCLCRARCQNNNKITLSHMSVACLFSLQQPGSFAMLIRPACTVRVCVCVKCECILISLPSYLSLIPRVAPLSFGNTCSQCARSVDDSTVQALHY